MFEADILDNLTISTENSWILTATYFMLSFGAVRLIPKHNINKFLETPIVKYHTKLGKILYIILLVIPICLPFSKISTFMIVGLVFFFLGLLLYVSGLFYFAISEYDKPATEGVYKYLKHPIYTGFFLILLGISVSTGSVTYLILSILYQINNLKLQKAEEKQCSLIYKDDYRNFLNKNKL